MLLEFVIENDRAFARESALSLIASKLKDAIPGRTVAVGDAGKTMALTSALLLGKNGSGKSTLVSGMRFVSNFVRNSSAESQIGEKISYSPNRLVKTCKGNPTRYQIVFSMNGVVYDFEFSHLRERVTYERLSVADQSIRFRKMYEREYNKNSDTYAYTFGDALSGRRSLWQESTRENALFLSTAAQLNSLDVQPAFDWLTDYLRVVSVGSPYFQTVTARMCYENKQRRKKIVCFLQALDINVEDIEIEEEPLAPDFLSTMFSETFIEFAKKNAGEMDFTTRLKIRFVKRGDSGQKEKFLLGLESTGTQVLFGLAGPLFEALENGHCLVVDEINTNLHPLVVKALIDLFADGDQNLKRAQLVFTSHDTSVLAQQRLRRDQVWIVESDGLSAQLVPLSDYSPRKGEALDKGYLGGRYGGVPIVSPVLFRTKAERE